MPETSEFIRAVENRRGLIDSFVYIARRVSSSFLVKARRVATNDHMNREWTPEKIQPGADLHEN